MLGGGDWAGRGARRACTCFGGLGGWAEGSTTGAASADDDDA